MEGYTVPTEFGSTLRARGDGTLVLLFRDPAMMRTSLPQEVVAVILG